VTGGDVEETLLEDMEVEVAVVVVGACVVVGCTVVVVTGASVVLVCAEVEVEVGGEVDEVEPCVSVVVLVVVVVVLAELSVHSYLA